MKTTTLFTFLLPLLFLSACGSIEVVPLDPNPDASPPSNPPSRPSTTPSPDVRLPSPDSPPHAPDATSPDTTLPIPNPTGGTDAQGAGGTGGAAGSQGTGGAAGVQGTGGTAGVSAAQGIKGEYFDSVDLRGRAEERIDMNINFDWSLGPPEVGNVSRDNFSVRWTGKITSRFSEVYTFYVGADDGVRVWVGSMLVIDHWDLHTALPEDTGTLLLKAGEAYDLRVEYCDRGAHAKIKLSWSSPSEPKAVIPASALTVP